MIRAGLLLHTAQELEQLRHHLVSELFAVVADHDQGHREYLQIHLSKKHLATVSACLLGMATSSTTFDQASVITITNLFPSWDVFSGPEQVYVDPLVRASRTAATT